MIVFCLRKAESRMSEINPYEVTIKSFVDKMKYSMPNSIYSDKKGNELASWDDDVWFFKSRKALRSCLVFADRYPKQSRSMQVRSLSAAQQMLTNYPLKNYYREFAKAEVIEILKSDKKERYNIARSLIGFISYLQSNNLRISQVSQNVFSAYLKELEESGAKALQIQPQSCLISILRLWVKASFLPICTKFRQVYNCDNTPMTRGKRHQEKKASADQILAMLSIYANIIPPIEEINSRTICPYSSTRNRYTAGMGLFCLAATQRFAAEGLFAAQNALQSQTTAAGQLVHTYLFQGSKGYRVNQKHIVGGLHPFVERMLRYCDVAFEPGRVLARFYENPNRPAKDILRNYPIDDWYGLNPNKSLDLFQLGGLLGLYNRYPEEVLNSITKIKGFPFDLDLDSPQPLGIKRNQGHWLGIRHSPQSQMPRFLVDNDGRPKRLTLREIQEGWIAYIKSSIANFPYRTHANGNKVHLADALVIFTGAQSHPDGITSAAFKWAKSPFAIETIGLDTLFYRQLSGPFFTENGFSELFGMAPNAIRHYNNTELQKANVGQELIAVVSGRKSVEQNIVYDHRTGEELSATLRQALGGINEKALEERIEANIVTVQEVAEMSGRHVEDVGGVGFCFQDLSQYPCTRRSQLRLHCVGCSKAMFCKGHPKAIAAMKKDVQRLQSQLTELYENNEWYKFTNGRQQFKEKTADMALCNELANIMQSPNFKDGYLIRVAKIKNLHVHFQIIDMKTHNIIAKPKAELPDVSALLQAKIDEVKPQKSNPLKGFFLKYGIDING